MRILRRRSMRPVRRSLVIAASLIVSAFTRVSPAAAGMPIGWDARGGWYTENNDFALGLGANVAFGTITFNPNAEYIFVNSGSSYSLNLDGRMTVLPLAVGSGWLGAGLGFYTTKPDHGSSNTDSGLNLLAGFGLTAIPLKPFAQYKYAMINGDNTSALMFGVRF